MRKSKLSVALVSSMVACMALAGCNKTITEDKSGEGYILTLTNSSGEKTNVSANDVFGEYYDSVSGVKTMFDSVYELLVRNYWKDESKAAKLEEIKRTATNQVKGVKATASSNQETNHSSYDDELDELLDSYGVDSLTELYNHFEYQAMKKEFEEEFYDAVDHDTKRTNLDDIRDGNFFNKFQSSTVNKGYLEEKIPYHVKHILVNVAASSGDLYNGQISSDNATKLARVVELLADQDKGFSSFGSIAKALSDDSGSAAAYGDLGIMDKDTGYINEFKLGVYAYESIFNKNTADNESLIGIPEAQKDYFKDNADAKIGQIPYGLFEELAKVADVDRDSNNNKVNDDQSFYYPRNVYFNKYLNNHRVAVIVPNNLPTADQLYQPDENGKASGTEAYVGSYNNDYAEKAGFVAKASEFQNVTWEGGNDDGKVLCDENGKVILVVRGGSSDYQGVHFIVVERSALQEVVNGVSLSDYYTTYYPGQENYPVDESGKDLDTYVNFNNAETKDLKSRAESVESKIKGYDSYLNTYVYEYLESTQSVQFTGDEGAKVKEAINKYIATQRAKAAYDSKESWEQTWNTYMEYIQQQTAERSKDKLLSATCAIKYTNPDKSGKEWSKGGMCGYDSGK